MDGLPHSKLGIASTIIAVAVALAFIVMMVLGVGAASTQDADAANGINVLNGLGLLCFVFPGLITGTILGLIASFKSGVKKTFGILGACLNGGGLLIILLLMVIGFAMGGG